jgi:hypothetical protein
MLPRKKSSIPPVLLTHADTGFGDIDRGFETALSRWIGHFAWKAISAVGAHK